MKLAVLVGTKRVLVVACVLILSPVLLASCGGETTIEENTIEETTVVEETTTESVQEGGTNEQEGAQYEEGIAPTPSPNPSPTPSPTPTPIPPETVQVECGIGAGGILNCANTAGTPFYCSGKPYGCTDPLDNRYGCEVAEQRMGGMTLSCTKLLQ